MRCDKCNGTAVANYQKVWKRFDIDKDENYREDDMFDPLDIEEPVGEDNLHLCRDHEKEFLGEV